VLSPADGRVVYVKRFSRGRAVCEKLGRTIPLEEITKGLGFERDGWIIGIYMSPLDVHFNYAPIDSVVEDVVHTPARVNLPMVDLWEYVKLTYLQKCVDLFSAKYRLVNERNTLFLRSGDIRLIIVEIADKFVNKISCYVKKGDELRAGQKISFIDRGSQVDVILFDPVRILCSRGDKVTGAITVLASYEQGDLLVRPPA